MSAGYLSQHASLRPPVVLDTLRHENGATVRLDLPMDAMLYAKVLLALGKLGFEFAHATPEPYIYVHRGQSADGAPLSSWERMRIGAELLEAIRATARDGQERSVGHDVVRRRGPRGELAEARESIREAGREIRSPVEGHHYDEELRRFVPDE